ncbi:hypothetical protein B0H14DRAFT_2656164 [Mycena olivaceomarginata]|nr:hypothetical protein B0H14DRAFT_2656164 [Mycena olivaceomarginata]
MPNMNSTSSVIFAIFSLHVGIYLYAMFSENFTEVFVTRRVLMVQLASLCALALSGQAWCNQCTVPPSRPLTSENCCLKPGRGGEKIGMASRTANKISNPCWLQLWPSLSWTDTLYVRSYLAIFHWIEQGVEIPINTSFCQLKKTLCYLRNSFRLRAACNKLVN